MDTPSESQLRQLDFTELAQTTKQHWNSVKGQIPTEARAEIEPCINVLTDPDYTKQFVGSGSGSSSR